MPSPDLSDPDVRALLDRNHKPKEVKHVDGLAAMRDIERVLEVKIQCTMCGQPYPCPTRQALRDQAKQELVQHWVGCGVPEPHETHVYRTTRGSYRCPGVAQSGLDCGRREPHEQHLWTQQPHLWPRLCPGTSYEIVDCDDVPNTSHKAHVWTFRGADFWCPGG